MTKKMTEFLRKFSKQDIRNTIAMLWVILSFVFLFKLLSREIPIQNKDVVNIVAGAVFGQLVTIIAYYFGQSKSEVDDKKREHEEA